MASTTCSQMLAPPHSLIARIAPPPMLTDAPPRTPCTCTHGGSDRADRCSPPALLALTALPPGARHGAGRYSILHTPCTYCVAVCAGTCCPRHTPCMLCGAARADRCLPLHTPYTHGGSDRAGRCACLPLHTPCHYCAAARAHICPAAGTVLPLVSGSALHRSLCLISPVAHCKRGAPHPDCRRSTRLSPKTS